MINDLYNPLNVNRVAQSQNADSVRLKYHTINDEITFALYYKVIFTRCKYTRMRS